jgi:hypothetical protein
MKSFILAALLFAAAPLRAQITPEHTYQIAGLSLVQTDSAEWKYIAGTFGDTVSIFNLDHSLDSKISLRTAHAAPRFVIWVARHLFSRDGLFDCLISVQDTIDSHPHLTYGLRVIHANGEVLFGCDTCDRAYGLGASYPGLTPSPILNSPVGAKMLVTHDTQSEVYSLPGRLPGSTQMLSVNPNSQSSWSQLESIAYPNPSSGRVRIAYDLPSGVTSGEIVLTASDGREVKRYHITNAFSDLLIEESDLPSGSYFYKVVTSRGESAAQRIVREK